MRKFTAIATIHPAMTYSIPKPERIHPIAGHTRNASPNAAPMSPIFFVFSAGVDISEIYACITQNPAPPSPVTIRERMKRINPRLYPAILPVPEMRLERLIKRNIYPMRLSPEVNMSIYFRP